MKKMIYMVMALASLSYSTQTMAQSQGLQKKVNAYFLQSLKAQQKALEKDGKAEFSKTHLLTPSSRLLSTARILPTTRRWYGQPGAMPTRTCRKKSS